MAEHNSIYTKENEKLISYNKVKVILLSLKPSPTLSTPSEISLSITLEIELRMEGKLGFC